ncbi:O-antigen ligase family protein [Bradyrhizobium sp. CCBAU 51627]|uniref:O-antigen ligase family protein n=1 Tax=Bradyrhizobium sp. CCBAU 51627 TaxID=1325088 RepID=UPI0023058E35|nr:hypothetical protein [Bradyrhizobium sp. CCBAU 51627]MDA9432244.1 hypothetical protein [Bradyrhizobium sp. CCBAU 51627]
MTASLTHNGREPYHLTLPHSVAQAGTVFFLLFVFMWPFQGALFLTDNLFDIQGFKPFNLLSAVVLAYLMFDTAPLHATDKIERRSIRIFLLYFATFAIALIRSVPNAPLLHSRFPGVPGSYVDFVLSACIVPAFYTLSFLFILRRMCSFRELERITTVICLSILLLSIAFIAVVLMNPSVLLSGHAGGMTDSDRDEMALLCIVYFGNHYNVIGTMFISTVPLLLYRALTRGALWIAPLCLSLLAVLLLYSRTALVAVAASCFLFLILRRRFGILVFGAVAAGVASLVWGGGPTVEALLSIGFGSGSVVSADALLTGRVEYIWRPLLEEWTSDIGLFLFGAGRYGIGTSQLWNTGTLLEKTVAHNAIIEFFLDCGVILTGVALMFLMAGTVTAWRVGRRLNSDLYWALFASMFGCGISMATMSAIFPTIENMYAFPIIAMMINVARLRYLDAYRDRPKTIQKVEEIVAR